MLNDKKKRGEVLSRIRRIENFKRSRDGITIAALGALAAAESAELAKSSDSLTPILRTALVIRARETAMKSRYKRFKEMFPEISTLAALQRVMDKTKPLDFCKKYLNIKAKTVKNPKYRLLRELTNGFLEYQKRLGLSSEIEAIRHWSSSVDLSDLKNDAIGKRDGVGPAVVQNIRLCLGERVIKGDTRVIGVMKNFLKVDIPPSSYDEFAREVGKDPRYLDSILFEYGKAKNISAKTSG